MASKNQEIVYLISTANTGHFYTTTKNKRGEKAKNKIEKKMFDPVIRGHVLYKEGKLKPKKK